MQAQDPLHGGAVREALQLPWRAKVPDTIGSDVRLSRYGDRLAFARLDLHRLLQPLEDHDPRTRVARMVVAGGIHLAVLVFLQAHCPRGSPDQAE